MVVFSLLSLAWMMSLCGSSSRSYVCVLMGTREEGGGGGGVGWGVEGGVGTNFSV